MIQLSQRRAHAIGQALVADESRVEELETRGRLHIALAAWNECLRSHPDPEMRAQALDRLFDSLWGIENKDDATIVLGSYTRALDGEFGPKTSRRAVQTFYFLIYGCCTEAGRIFTQIDDSFVKALGAFLKREAAGLPPSCTGLGASLPGSLDHLKESLALDPLGHAYFLLAGLYSDEDAESGQLAGEVLASGLNGSLAAELALSADVADLVAEEARRAASLWDGVRESLCSDFGVAQWWDEGADIADDV